MQATLHALRSGSETDRCESIRATLARIAVRSLHAELALYPKPGLVSPRDNGAHDDMDVATFMRSIFALRHYFAAIAEAGARAASMQRMRELGIAAEARMLAATSGVNTHRGAIFTLGLLTAAAARAESQRRQRSDRTLREIIATHWRCELLAVQASSHAAPSHGRQVALRYGVAGARGEAIRAFPSVFEMALPALRFATARGANLRRARLHAFFTLLAHVDDTNVLYRGGGTAAMSLRHCAAEFLVLGSVFVDGWERRAEALHRFASSRGLSPGGCADLLGATIFVDQWLTREP